MIKSALFCVWLIPAKPFYTSLQEQINLLADSFDAPVFAPHMTLFCGKTEDLQKTKNDFSRLLDKENSLSLKAVSVNASAAYYKTLYIQLENNNIVSNLQVKLKNFLDPHSFYLFSPHISLLYKDMPVEEKQKLILPAWECVAKYIHFSHQILFDKVLLMSDCEEENADAVKSWKLLAEYNLIKELP